MYGLAYGCAMRHHVLPLQVPQQGHCPVTCVVASSDERGPFRSSRTPGYENFEGLNRISWPMPEPDMQAHLEGRCFPDACLSCVE